MRTLVLLVVVAALAGAVVTRPAMAAWPESGRAITTAPKNQNDVHTVSDGAGGAIVIWVDAGSGVVDLFAHHVLATGELDPAWPIGGRALLTDPASLPGPFGSQVFPGAVSDGAGGAIVAWVDGRSSVSGGDIFAQHVLANGKVDDSWPANGVALTTAAGNQDNLAIVSDGAGGAIVTWMDRRGLGTGIDLFAQHVLSSGVVDPEWKTDGAAVCTAPETQSTPRMDTDGAGGAIITWFDRRSAQTGFDIFAQHLLSSGIPDLEWPTDGRAICTLPGSQFLPAIVSDGAGGAIVAWSDDRDGTTHIFAHHVLAAGTLDRAFPVDGLAVVTAPIEQQRALLVPDGAGGAIVSWEDQRSGVHNMFAHHLRASGSLDPGWPVNGIALSNRPREQSGASMVADGFGGAVVAWQDGGVDIFAQHVLSTGTLDPAFPAGGQAVIALPTRESNPSVVAAGGGSGAIVAWTDFRADSTSDVYALQLLTLLTADVDGGAPRDVSFAAPSPNPAHGSLSLRFRLPRDAGVRLTVHDAAGRRVRVLASGSVPAGEHSVGWDLRDEAGRAVDTGLYFARLDVEGRVLTRKLAALR